MRSIESDQLLSQCLSAEAQGSAIVHIYRHGEQARLVVWRKPLDLIEEIEAGAGPHVRPSRGGFPSLRYAEEQEFAAEDFTQGPFEPTVGGTGMHVMPLGPVRADVAESLRFEFQVLGDEIHGLTLRRRYKTRGIAGLMRGKPAGEALEVAERVTGTSPVAHALCFSLAVEDALGIEAGEETAGLRSALAEIERLQSHLGDLAALAAATGTVVAAADLYRLRESVLRFAYRVSGHRYLRGALAPGGWRRLPADLAVEARGFVDEVERGFAAVRRALERTNSFLDRLHGAGRIPRDIGLDLVGVVARGGGGAEDVRFDRPYAAYERLCARLRPAAEASADAFGRYFVRCEEIAGSLTMLRQVSGLDASVRDLSADPGDGVGYGLVEAPRGRLFYRVELQAGRVAQVQIRTPSSINWTAVPPAMANHNILQDFPIIDASFALAVSALDL